MLGTNAKERERRILLFLYLRKPTSFNAAEIAHQVELNMGVIEALEDLRQYEYLEIHPDFNLLESLISILDFTKGKGEKDKALPRFRITDKGIQYVHITEFKRKGVKQ